MLRLEHNLKAIAKRLDRNVKDLVVTVLDRPRHEKLIADIRKTGARIRLISDGDLSAGISAAVSDMGVHAVMGTGGAPEGVLTAAALRCLNGQILGAGLSSKPEHRERLAKMGIKDPKKIYETADLAPGKKIIFACTGVTPGGLLRGVRFFGGRNANPVAHHDATKTGRFVSSTPCIWKRDRPTCGYASTDSDADSAGGRCSRPRAKQCVRFEFLCFS